jgi:N-acetylglucosaminyl-diphospho-decaprenol L-rhamnosyltransferase
MHVAILIVAYRDAEIVVDCLKALERSTHTDFEVFVLENGGAEAFERLDRALPKRLAGGQPVTVRLASGNLGFAGGVNEGFRATPDADCWWVLNPDTAPEPDALAVQLERLAKGDCDAVGCTLYLPNGKIQSHGGHWNPWLARSVSIGIDSDVSAPVDPAYVERTQNYLNGAAMLISKRFVEKAGLMREDYFLYCEESEWCMRALELGLKLGFEPRARVLHIRGATTGAGEDMIRRPRLPIFLGERNKILATRDRCPGRLPVAAVFTLAQIFMRYARRGAWAQFGYALDGWVAGLRNERGPPKWA